jgi:hypothetical protein
MILWLGREIQAQGGSNLHDGAGVGLRKTKPGPRLLPGSSSAPARLPIFRSLDQCPAVSWCRFPAFLPGSGQKVEVIENTPLNPLYPVLELHISGLGMARSFAKPPLLTILQDAARLC